MARNDRRGSSVENRGSCAHGSLLVKRGLGTTTRSGARKLGGRGGKLGPRWGNGGTRGKRRPPSPEPFDARKEPAPKGNGGWGLGEMPRSCCRDWPAIRSPCASPSVSLVPWTQNADPHPRIGAYLLLHSLPIISVSGLPRMRRRTGTRICLYQERPGDARPANGATGTARRILGRQRSPTATAKIPRIPYETGRGDRDRDLRQRQQDGDGGDRDRDLRQRQRQGQRRPPGR